jgi:hypothetical protein
MLWPRSKFDLAKTGRWLYHTIESFRALARGGGSGLWFS